MNHLMLYLSVWFALTSQLILIILQKLVLGDEIANFMTTRVFTFQVGLALVAPGILQLFLEFGVIKGMWKYLSHFGILAIYSTFHILNISSYWQYGLKNSAFYLASGRGTGLEHYFLKDMYDNFYKTHWRAGYIIFWMGILALILGGSWLVFVVMYLLPSGIWLWGAMFLNPGSLPSTVHEEQWKRLMNRDMQEARDIVKQRFSHLEHKAPIRGSFIKKFFVGIWRSIKQFGQLLLYVYHVVNFAIHMRVVRLIAMLTLLWENIISERIPTFIFTDERRRVLRWDEDDNRKQSIFFSTMAHEPAVKPVDATITRTPSQKQLPPLPKGSSTLEHSASSRPLPAPPPKREKPSRKRSVRWLQQQQQPQGEPNQQH